MWSYTEQDRFNLRHGKGWTWTKKAKIKDRLILEIWAESQQINHWVNDCSGFRCNLSIARSFQDNDNERGAPARNRDRVTPASADWSISDDVRDWLRNKTDKQTCGWVNWRCHLIKNRLKAPLGVYHNQNVVISTATCVKKIPSVESESWRQGYDVRWRH